MPEKAHSFYKRFTIILMIAFISTQCSDDDIIFEQFDSDVTAEFKVLPGFKVEIFQSVSHCQSQKESQRNIMKINSARNEHENPS